MPDGRPPRKRTAFTNPSRQPLPPRLIQRLHDHRPRVRIDRVPDRIHSVSFITALPPDERERLAGRIRDLVASDAALAGKAEVTFPYVILAIAADRL